MSERGSTKQVWIGSLLGLIGVGWLLGTPYLVFGAIITSAPFLGETPSPEEMNQATVLLVGGLLCGLALPILGMIVAAVTGMARAVLFFAAALAVSLVGLALLVSS